jgi:hypothetical protein
MSDFAAHFCIAFLEVDNLARTSEKGISFTKRKAKMDCEIGRVNGPLPNSDEHNNRKSFIRERYHQYFILKNS